jgi:hypothetical protein
MRCDLHHKAAPFLQGQLKSEQFRTHTQESYLRELLLQVAWSAEINYLVVLTIARRREPFANCKEIRVSLELIGENFTILPVTPVLLVVNKSPIWYVYPPSVICIAFRLWWFVLFNFTRF